MALPVDAGDPLNRLGTSRYRGPDQPFSISVGSHTHTRARLWHGRLPFRCSATSVIQPRSGGDFTIPAANIVTAGKALQLAAAEIAGKHIVNVYYTLSKGNERGDLLGLLAADDIADGMIPARGRGI